MACTRAMASSDSGEFSGDSRSGVHHRTSANPCRLLTPPLSARILLPPHSARIPSAAVVHCWTSASATAPPPPDHLTRCCASSRLPAACHRIVPLLSQPSAHLTPLFTIAGGGEPVNVPVRPRIVASATTPTPLRPHDFDSLCLNGGY
uniref:Uncharacterized protein n=1 Tax=Oryza sativa subsp. japonica TaxID=39947 RepID=Q656C6_ORYSJ|nr:hypothetical protein [Oryza sativa Japonica Group]